MPKHSVTITFKDFVEEHNCPELADLADHIIEYAPDYNFPDNTDQDSIDWAEHKFDSSGDLVMTFNYELEKEDGEEEEDEDDDSQDPDGSEGEDL